MWAGSLHPVSFTKDRQDHCITFLHQGLVGLRAEVDLGIPGAVHRVGKQGSGWMPPTSTPMRRRGSESVVSRRLRVMVLARGLPEIPAAWFRPNG